MTVEEPFPAMWVRDDSAGAPSPARIADAGSAPAVCENGPETYV